MAELQRPIRLVRRFDAQQRRHGACVALGARSVLDRGGGGLTANSVAYRAGGVTVLLQRTRHLAGEPSEVASVVAAEESPKASVTSALIASGSMMLTSWSLMLS